MQKVRTRYAPSPTGIPHVGNIRTALFSFLLARSQKGDFILRIEDTDQKRSTREHITDIKESLNFLNIEWDEYYLQSERLQIYQKHLEILKKKGVVYEEEGAWRFKVLSKNEKIGWEDIVHKRVEFPVRVIEDFIVVKSDGYPTYHFASVVDDHEMQISHVLRGDEWISSTPKHLLLYEAFGWDPPQFCHLPAILGANKKKLSKREGAKSVREYIDQGYLPQALINFLSLLGWAPKDNREIFTLIDLIAEFSLDRLNKNSPIFDIEKLNWMNGQWIRKIDEKNLAEIIANRFPHFSTSQILENLPLVKDRLSTLDDFPKIAGFLIQEEINVDPSQVILGRDKLQKFVDDYSLIKLSNWNKANIGSVTISLIESEKLEKPAVLSSLGTAVSGSTVTPPIYDSLEKLGKERTLERLREVIKNKNKQ